MFQVLGVFAEFERALIREGVMAGLVYGQRPKALDLGGPQPSRMMQPRFDLIGGERPCPLDRAPVPGALRLCGAG